MDIARSKDKVKGGHNKNYFGLEDGDKLFYYNKRPVLEAPYTKVQDGQMGAISLEDLTAIWIFNEKENKYVNCIEYYRCLREELLSSKGKSRR